MIYNKMKSLEEQQPIPQKNRRLWHQRDDRKSPIIQLLEGLCQNLL